MKTWIRSVTTTFFNFCVPGSRSIVISILYIEGINVRAGNEDIYTST